MCIFDFRVNCRFNTLALHPKSFLHQQPVVEVTNGVQSSHAATQDSKKTSCLYHNNTVTFPLSWTPPLTTKLEFPNKTFNTDGHTRWLPLSLF